MKVLIVDDDPTTRLVLRRLLVRDLGSHTITEAKDGRAAMRALERASYDLVLLDLMMPHMDGIEVLQAIRASPRLASQDVVVLTTDRSRHLVRPALALSVKDFLAKPFSRKAVLDRLERVLSGEPRYRELFAHYPWLRVALAAGALALGRRVDIELLRSQLWPQLIEGPGLEARSAVAWQDGAPCGVFRVWCNTVLARHLATAGEGGSPEDSRDEATLVRVVEWFRERLVAAFADVGLPISFRRPDVVAATPSAPVGTEDSVAMWFEARGDMAIGVEISGTDPPPASWTPTPGLEEETEDLALPDLP